MKFLIPFMLLHLLPNGMLAISIKCNSSIQLGDLLDVEHYQKSMPEIVEDVFGINSTYNQFSKLERNLSRVVTLDMHPFIGAIHLAYINHLKLSLSPDMIWHLITASTSSYINQHSEDIRGKFVAHLGKENIIVQRDNFPFNSSTNEWNEVIEAFAHELDSRTLNNVSSLFAANFTTTNDVNSVIGQIVLMESMQKYFQFEFVSLCAIPEIYLEGTRSDWSLIKEKLLRLNETLPGLSVWYDKLAPILDKFIQVYDLPIDLNFWNQIYKVHGGSGGPYISGWIITFFPYIEKNLNNYYVWNKSWLDAYDEPMFGGLVTSNFPITMTRVDFKWKYYAEEYDMLFIGGFVGIDYNKEEKRLAPIFGYSVCQDIK